MQHKIMQNHQRNPQENGKRVLLDENGVNIYEKSSKEKTVEELENLKEKVEQKKVKDEKNPKEKIRYISNRINKIFYKENIPINWTENIQFLIDQIENPKNIIKKTLKF